MQGVIPVHGHCPWCPHMQGMILVHDRQLQQLPSYQSTLQQPGADYGGAGWGGAG